MKTVSMKAKTILGISFTTVFVLSALSTITAMQADSMFKIRHLPDFKSIKSDDVISIGYDTPNEKIKSVFVEPTEDYKNFSNIQFLKN